MTSRRFLSLRGYEIRVLACAFLTALLAKAAVFLHAYSLDDYHLYLHPVSFDGLLSQGRFGQFLLVKFLYLIGPGPPHIAMVSAFMLLPAAALFSTLIVRHWGISRQHSLAVTAACLMTTHPFTASIYTFRYTLIVTASAFALMALVLLDQRRSALGILARASLFMAALSVYQIVFNYAVMIILTGCVISMARFLVVSGRISSNRRLRRLLSLSMILRHRNSVLLFVFALGTFLYLILNRIVLAASGIAGDRRSELVSFEALGLRVDQIIRALKRDFLYSDSFLPIFTHRLLWSLAIIGVIGLLYHFFIPRRRFKGIFGWHRVSPLALLFVAAAAAVVWAIGVNIVLESWYVPPRVKEHVGVLWACALVVPFYCAGRRVKRLLLLIAAVAIASFISVSNGILSDQIRLNNRDRLFANRVLTRLETLPDFPQVDVVAIPTNGWPDPFRYEVWLQATRHGGGPAFSVNWAKVNILREISGYDLRNASASEMEIARDYCRKVEIWPAESSVVIRDQMAIICLQQPRSRK